MPRSRLTVLRLAALCLLAPLLPLSSGLSVTHAGSGSVNVLYAGSLVSLNETLLGPAFSSATSYAYQGKSAGSLAIVNQIKGHIATPDVVELADPAANRSLMGQANGNYVSWYFTFARSQLVIGFDARSRFAKAFRSVQHHKLAWYKALEQKGMRIGRTDPNLDPKGYRALFMAGLAQRVYHLKGLKHRVFGSNENPSQIFPEEVLVARMLTGQVDAGVFYLSEVRDLGIPYISLPAKVNLGSQKYASLYRTQSFKTNKGVTVTGAPILYSVTIPKTVANAAGAQAFVRFILSPRIRSLASSHGLLPTRITVGGSRQAVPHTLTQFIGKG